MTVSRTFAGRFEDLALDPETREILITIAVPIAGVGPLLDELARWSGGMRDAPVTITTGRAARAIGDLLAQHDREPPRE